MFKVGNVTVMVSDMKRALEFYTRTLGMALKYEAGPDWAEVSMQDLTIGLHTAGDHSPRPGTAGAMSIGLMVDNLETAMDALKKQHVKFSPHISEDGPVRLAFFGDPDGNPLYLCEVKHAATQAHGAGHGTAHH